MSSENQEINAKLQNMKFEDKTKKKLYALKDVKDGFLPTFTASNDMVALRILSDEVNNHENKNNPLVAHPEDYELYFVGYYIKETGELISEVKFMARAMDYIRKVAE